MKYNVGDKVRIKSLDWYNENKDEYGYIDCGSRAFFTKMSDWCGKIVTIKEICKTNCYHLEEYDFDWTDEMIEGLVEEEVGLVDNLSSRWVNEFNLPDGYIFKDENGNIINAQKIALEKKKKEYPKTYEECLKILGFNVTHKVKATQIFDYDRDIIALQRLKRCRDAYWKIAGKEMGLGKPWSPDLTDNVNKHCIEFRDRGVYKVTYSYTSRIFAFPTEEMRDAFYENFKELIEGCKELL